MKKRILNKNLLSEVTKQPKHGSFDALVTLACESERMQSYLKSTERDLIGYKVIHT